MNYSWIVILGLIFGSGTTSCLMEHDDPESSIKTQPVSAFYVDHDLFGKMTNIQKGAGVICWHPLVEDFQNTMMNTSVKEALQYDQDIPDDKKIISRILTDTLQEIQDTVLKLKKVEDFSKEASKYENNMEDSNEFTMSKYKISYFGIKIVELLSMNAQDAGVSPYLSLYYTLHVMMRNEDSLHKIQTYLNNLSAIEQIGFISKLMNILIGNITITRPQLQSMTTQDIFQYASTNTINRLAAILSENCGSIITALSFMDIGIDYLRQSTETSRYINEFLQQIIDYNSEFVFAVCNRYMALLNDIEEVPFKIQDVKSIVSAMLEKKVAIEKIGKNDKTYSLIDIIALMTIGYMHHFKKQTNIHDDILLDYNDIKYTMNIVLSSLISSTISCVINDPRPLIIAEGNIKTLVNQLAKEMSSVVQSSNNSVTDDKKTWKMFKNTISLNEEDIPFIHLYKIEKTDHMNPILARMIKELINVTSCSSIEEMIECSWSAPACLVITATRSTEWNNLCKKNGISMNSCIFIVTHGIELAKVFMYKEVFDVTSTCVTPDWGNTLSCATRAAVLSIVFGTTNNIYIKSQLRKMIDEVELIYNDMSNDDIKGLECAVNDVLEQSHSLAMDIVPEVFKNVRAPVLSQEDLSHIARHLKAFCNTKINIVDMFKHAKNSSEFSVIELFTLHLIRLLGKDSRNLLYADWSQALNAVLSTYMIRTSRFVETQQRGYNTFCNEMPHRFKNLHIEIIKMFNKNTDISGRNLDTEWQRIVLDTEDDVLDTIGKMINPSEKTKINTIEEHTEISLLAKYIGLWCKDNFDQVMGRSPSEQDMQGQMVSFLGSILTMHGIDMTYGLCCEPRYYLYCTTIFVAQNMEKFVTLFDRLKDKKSNAPIIMISLLGVYPINIKAPHEDTASNGLLSDIGRYVDENFVPGKLFTKKDIVATLNEYLEWINKIQYQEIDVAVVRNTNISDAIQKGREYLHKNNALKRIFERVCRRMTKTLLGYFKWLPSQMRADNTWEKLYPEVLEFFGKHDESLFTLDHILKEDTVIDDDSTIMPINRIICLAMIGGMFDNIEIVESIETSEHMEKYITMQCNIGMTKFLTMFLTNMCKKTDQVISQNIPIMQHAKNLYTKLPTEYQSTVGLAIEGLMGILDLFPIDVSNNIRQYINQGEYLEAIKCCIKSLKDLSDINLDKAARWLDIDINNLSFNKKISIIASKLLNGKEILPVLMSHVVENKEGIIEFIKSLIQNGDFDSTGKQMAIDIFKAIYEAIPKKTKQEILNTLKEKIVSSINSKPISGAGPDADTQLLVDMVKGIWEGIEENKKGDLRNLAIDSMCGDGWISSLLKRLVAN